MILHLQDAVNLGYKKVILRTVDTDLVVLAVTATVEINIQELRVAFGTGRHCRYILARKIATSLDPDKSRSIPIFHAYTGCDTVSSFGTEGKKSAWETWKVFEEAIPTFLGLSSGPEEKTDYNVPVLGRLTIVLYDQTSDLTSIDKLERSCSPRRRERWMPSHQHEVPWCSTSRG